MDLEKLRGVQEPLKLRYRENSTAAIAELHASGKIDLNRLVCNVHTPNCGSGMTGTTESGLHPQAGGDGQSACSGDMLLQALVACSGVTFAAVATAMQLQISSASVEAHGTMDFRGTLGVDRNTPVGLTGVMLTFQIESNESPQKLDKLVQLTERYCVVLQTLKQGVSVVTGRQ